MVGENSWTTGPVLSVQWTVRRGEVSDANTAMAACTNFTHACHQVMSSEHGDMTNIGSASATNHSTEEK